MIPRQVLAQANDRTCSGQHLIAVCLLDTCLNNLFAKQIVELARQQQESVNVVVIQVQAGHLVQPSHAVDDKSGRKIEVDGEGGWKGWAFQVIAATKMADEKVWSLRLWSEKEDEIAEETVRGSVGKETLSHQHLLDGRAGRTSQKCETHATAVVWTQWYGHHHNTHDMYAFPSAPK